MNLEKSKEFIYLIFVIVFSLFFYTYVYYFLPVVAVIFLCVALYKRITVALADRKRARR